MHGKHIAEKLGCDGVCIEDQGRLAWHFERASEALHRKNSNMLDMLDVEKRERAGHFDAHRDEHVLLLAAVNGN